MTYTTENISGQTETTEISFDFDSMDLDSNTMKVWERKEVAQNKRIVAKRIRSNVMKRAWQIRKEASVKFGCRVSEVDFSECMKQAWSEI